MANYFEELNSINLTDKIEKKNGLSYVSWAFAWQEVKKRFPEANYTVYKNKDEWNYFTDGKTCWVEVGVTINGLEHREPLPVMDYRNKSIELDKVTSMDVCKSIQRALTKACARHGLGLYVYAGEDLPETEGEPQGENKKPTQSLKDLIANCKTEDELSELYNKNKTTITSNDELLQKMVAKGKELKQVA